MFYADHFSGAYRLGDIVQGYSEIITTFSNSEIDIRIAKHDYFVILTPCCSIENREVAIVPLKQIDTKFLMSDYLINDFLKINKKMKRREAIGDIVFRQKSQDKQIEIENTPEGYEYIDKFIYDGHALLPEYQLEKRRSKDDTVIVKTNKYMISFKDMVKIYCDAFLRNNTNCVKLLELHPSTREELRQKISHFYLRAPQEDLQYSL